MSPIHKFVCKHMYSDVHFNTVSVATSSPERQWRSHLTASEHTLMRTLSATDFNKFCFSKQVPVLFQLSVGETFRGPEANHATRTSR
jgi:hypothetical protein